MNPPARARDIPTYTADVAYIMHVMSQHTTRAHMAEIIANYIKFKLALQYELLTGEQVLDESEVAYETENL